MCGECWLEQEMHFEPDGTCVFRPPVQVKGAPPAECCYCGQHTRLGIFVRRTPEKAHCGWGEQESVAPVAPATPPPEPSHAADLLADLAPSPFDAIGSAFDPGLSSDFGSSDSGSDYSGGGGESGGGGASSDF